VAVVTYLQNSTSPRKTADIEPVCMMDDHLAKTYATNCGLSKGTWRIRGLFRYARCGLGFTILTGCFPRGCSLTGCFAILTGCFATGCYASAIATGCFPTGCYASAIATGCFLPGCFAIASAIRLGPDDFYEPPRADPHA